MADIMVTKVDGIKFEFWGDIIERCTWAKNTETGEEKKIREGGYVTKDLTVRKAIADVFGLSTFRTGDKPARKKAVSHELVAEVASEEVVPEEDIQDGSKEHPYICPLVEAEVEEEVQSEDEAEDGQDQQEVSKVYIEHGFVESDELKLEKNMLVHKETGEKQKDNCIKNTENFKVYMTKTADSRIVKLCEKMSGRVFVVDSKELLSKKIDELLKVLEAAVA